MKLDRDELIRARERLGYAVETVAEEAGVSKNSVLRAEHGQDIRPLTARKIAGALGVAVADLYREPDYPKAKTPPSQRALFNNGVPDRDRRPPDITVQMGAAELSAEGKPLTITVKREQVLRVLHEQGMSAEKADATWRELERLSA